MEQQPGRTGSSCRIAAAPELTSVVWRWLLVVCLLKVLSARGSCFQQQWCVDHQASVSPTLWAGLPTAMEGLELQRKGWCFTLSKPLLHCQLRSLCSFQTWLLLTCTYFVLSSGCRETPGPDSFSCSVISGLFCARDLRSMSQSWKPHPKEALAVRWEFVPATRAGPNPTFPISASSRVQTAQESTVQSSRWVGCPEDKEISWVWNRAVLELRQLPLAYEKLRFKSTGWVFQRGTWP